MSKTSEIEMRSGADGASAEPHHPASTPAERKPVLAETARSEAWLRVRKLALRQLDRLMALEPKVLRDESPKPAHDLRVASRRLQALLDFLYAKPRPAGIRKLRRRLRKARQVLGELRNLDVLTARTERALGRKRTAHREAWQAGHDYVSKLRRKTATRSHRKLTRLNLSELYVRLRHELNEPPPGAGPQPAPPPRVIAFPDDRPAADASGSGVDEFDGRFATRLAGLWTDFESRASEARHDRGALHSFRIAVKRLRYHIEVAAGLDVAGSAQALAWLRALQTKLGDWHDYEVLGDTLLAMVAHGHFLVKRLSLAIEAEKLVLGLRRSKTRTVESFLREAFKSGEYRRTAEWVAQRADSRALTAG